MKLKIWLGLLLLVGSYGQLLFPRRLFTDPDIFFLGYPVVPGNLLAGTAAMSALGIILLGEGVCERLSAPSLSGLILGGKAGVGWILAGAATAGLTMELLAQWLGKLWIYPYWTPWFYWLVVLPGFVFYWTAIVESYLAVKAFLDSAIGEPGLSGKRLSRSFVALAGVAGVVLCAVVVWRYAAWYKAHGGYHFATTAPVSAAPPFTYVLLAFLGAFLLAEWGLRSQRRLSFAGALRSAYWVPAVAVVVSSVLVSLVVESQNAVNDYWLYTHFPEPGITLMGVPLTVYATWPLQYLTFLLMPSLFGVAIANLFWGHPPVSNMDDQQS